MYPLLQFDWNIWPCEIKISCLCMSSLVGSPFVYFQHSRTVLYPGFDAGCEAFSKLPTPIVIYTFSRIYYYTYEKCIVYDKKKSIFRLSVEKNRTCIKYPGTWCTTHGRRVTRCVRRYIEILLTYVSNCLYCASMKGAMDIGPVLPFSGLYKRNELRKKCTTSEK